MTPSIIRTIPRIIAIYIGCAIENTASTIARIPISKTSIDAKVERLLFFDINPAIPNTIIINPMI